MNESRKLDHISFFFVLALNCYLCGLIEIYDVFLCFIKVS